MNSTQQPELASQIKSESGEDKAVYGVRNLSIIVPHGASYNYNSKHHTTNAIKPNYPGNTYDQVCLFRLRSVYSVALSQEAEWNGGKAWPHLMSW